MAANAPMRAAAVARSLRLAKLLDTAFRIPGTRIRFGLDPILGVLPGLGDAVAALLGSYIVWTAARIGAPPVVIGRMLLNVAVDAVVGAVPVLGTLFDVAFKAHRRNAGLLADWSASPEAIESRQRRLFVALAIVPLAVLGIALVTLAFGVWALVALLG